ncbi:hypothetical protein ACLOJK_033713 [Asimina triloba]
MVDFRCTCHRNIEAAEAADAVEAAEFVHDLPSPLLRSPSKRLLQWNVIYASANITEDYSAATIDVVADVKSERVVVLGGSGFVGSAICKAAISKGIEVVSLSRCMQNFIWSIYFLMHSPPTLSGDVFYARWDEVLVGATAVVSTIGGFGNDERMKKINGEANVLAVDAAKEYVHLSTEFRPVFVFLIWLLNDKSLIVVLAFTLQTRAGIPKFILISVHDYNLPSFLLSSGYFTGKRKAESEVLSKYPNSGVVLRPGFIYGKRRVDGFEIPLDLIGEPLERLLNAVENFTKPLSSLPASDLLLAPPVSVDDVALAVVNAITDDDVFGVFTIEQIKEAAAKVKASENPASLLSTE